jgi:excisionase family DNA binding protein
MEPLLTTEQVAEWLRVDVVTVRRLIDRGELAAYRVGGEYRFERKDVQEYLARVRVEKPSKSGARRPVEEILAWLRGDQPTRSGPDRFDRFTDRARRVLTLAQEEAQRLRHNYVGTEHLLLGLVSEGEGVGARTLADMGVDIGRVRDEVESLVGRGDRTPTGEIGLTPRAKKAIELAVDEARRLKHHYLGTEHLLLGMLGEREGVAARVLTRLGVDLDSARGQVARLLGEQ